MNHTRTNDANTCAKDGNPARAKYAKDRRSTKKRGFQWNPADTGGLNHQHPPKRKNPYGTRVFPTDKGKNGGGRVILTLGKG